MHPRSAFVLVLVLASSIAACGGAVAGDPGRDGAGRDAVNAGPPSPSTPSTPSTPSEPASPPQPAAPAQPAQPTQPALPGEPPQQPYAWVASCPAAPVASWVPAALPTGSIDDFRAYGDAARASIVGHWRGQQSVYGTTPPVAFSFEATGHYSGMCLEAMCAALVSWGTDAEYPQKKYRLPDLTIDGVLSGTIDVAFPPQPAMGENPNDPPWVPPLGQTLLQNVKLDASGNRLRFDFVSYINPTPMTAHYELWRCP